MNILVTENLGEPYLFFLNQFVDPLDDFVRMKQLRQFGSPIGIVSATCPLSTIGHHAAHIICR